MQYFRFTVRDGSKEVWSKVEALTSLQEARLKAVENAVFLLKKVGSSFWQESYLQIEISEDSGLLLCIINISGTDAPACRQSATRLQ